MLGKFLPTMDFEAMAYHGRELIPTPATFGLIGLTSNFKYQGGTVMFNFNLPIFAGGERILGAKKVAYEIQKLVLKNRDDRQLLKIKVSTLYDDLSLYLQEIRQAKLQVRANKKVVHIKQVKLKLQKGTYDDYLNATTKYKKSLDHYSQVRNAYIDKVLQIHKVSGTLTPGVIYKINKMLV